MDRSAAAGCQTPRPVRRSRRSYVQIEAVLLLGVRVTAYATINEGEHQRRQAAKLTAVTDPALLDRLMDLPVGIPVADPVISAEMVDQLLAIVERNENGATVTRRLVPPLAIEDVVVNATAGHELAAVRDASLFAGFTRRWVAVARSRVSDATVLEAKLCGVGVIETCRKVMLSAEKPVCPTMDGWSWLLQEKTYRRWLKQPPRAHVMGTLAVSTGEANVTWAE